MVPLHAHHAYGSHRRQESFEEGLGEFWWAMQDDCEEKGSVTRSPLPFAFIPSSFLPLDVVPSVHPSP